MADVNLDQISPLLPVDFFSVGLDLHGVDQKGLKKKHNLPHFKPLLDEIAFADVAIGWTLDGIVCRVDVGTSFKDCQFPDYRRGDSVELFIDTRDGKASGFVTRFCHHFVFLPKEVDGIQKQEVTHFRAEERHELCDAEKLLAHTEFGNSSYQLDIFIPSECLHGYDPTSFERLGFAYRINRAHGKAQHFCLSSRSVQIEQQPSLWSSMEMKAI